MEIKNKELIIGYDLSNDKTQIACYNSHTEDIDVICYIGSEIMEQIPTVLCRVKEEDRWLCGYDAWNAVNKNQGVLVEDFVNKVEEDQAIDVDGEQYTAAELIRIFIQESLKLIVKYYPHWAIRQLTVTVECTGQKMISAIKEIGKTFEMDASRITVISHVTAYEYYAMNQDKSLWQQDVGLFEYSKNGMTYYHLNISKKRSPVVVTASVIPLDRYFDGSEIKNEAPEELDRRFLEAVQKVTLNRIISTVYLTGDGFDGDWAKISLKHLCHRRKGYTGSNIFSKGACYFALKMAGVLKCSHFIALNEDVVSSTIYMEGSCKREAVFERLVPAGTIWYEAAAEVVFIPVNMQAFTLHVKDYVNQKEKSVQIPLDAFDAGQEKHCHCPIRMKVCFEAPGICHIQLEDIGFGEFYIQKHIEYEQSFALEDLEIRQRDMKDEGRLILIGSKINTVPYYFHISGVRVYSLEQLCFYIYNNVYAVNKDTFDESLFYWIEKNTEEKALVKRLRDAKKSHRPVKELVRLLLTYVDYYSKREIEDVLNIMGQIELQNPIEAKKVEGDNYLRYGRCMEALATYKKVLLLAEKNEEFVTNEFKGNVNHNLGIAFARLGSTEAALDCFKKAYELNHSDASGNAWVSTLMLLGRTEEMQQETAQLMLSPEEVHALKSQIEEAGEDFQYLREMDVLQKLKDVHSEHEWNEVSSEVMEWIEGLKREYR